MEPGQQPRRWWALVQRYAHFSAFLLLVIATYVAWSLLAYGGWTGFLLVAVTCVTGLQGMVSAARGRPPGAWALALAGVACALALVGALADLEPCLSVASLLAILVVAACIVVVVRDIVLAQEVTADSILGAVSVYSLLGILFAHAYGAVHHLGAQPFFAGHPGADGSDFIFFSYTTLTTTGYGDLVPSGQPGELLAGLEMLVGQIFLVTLVARLVAVWKPGERLRARRGGGD
ncbi:MAG TPA: ion channel [Solirubrobacterales bacterium]|jgi:Ion channel.